VLVVDDQPETADTLALLLRQVGYEVWIARDGNSALAAARSHHPDVVLLDIGLPDMEGYDVARQLHQRRSNRSPYLVAVTGHGEDVDRLRSEQAGLDLHLVKPVDPDTLTAILEHFQETLRS
jgi:CheY-like chemotaxis protein